MPKRLLNKSDLKPLPKGFKRVLKKRTFKLPALTLVMMMLALGFTLSDADVLAYAATTNFAVTTHTSTVQATAPTFSEYWYQDNNGGWHINDENGNTITNAWLCDDAVVSNNKDIWYLIDSNGNMVSAGLVQDQTGNIYSLETNHEGYYGMLRYKSGVYDGIYLDLTSDHSGAFGNINNQDGRSGLQAIYGLTTVNIDNNNIVYTSSFRNSKGSYSSGNNGSGNTSSDKDKFGNTKSTGELRASDGSVIPQDFVDGCRDLGYNDDLIREMYDANKNDGGGSGVKIDWN